MPAVKAAGMGALFGTAALLAMLVVTGWFTSSEGLGLIILLMVVSLPLMFIMALVGLGVIGVPVTLLLHRERGESRNAYVVAGIAGGLLIAFLFLSLSEVWVGILLALFLVPGPVAGGATAWFWYKYARERAEIEELEPIKEVFE